MKSHNFLAELKRRNVYKVAVAYAVVGWLVMQVAATVVPALHLPDVITTAVVVLVFLGFPIALVLAWAYVALTLARQIGPDRAAVDAALKQLIDKWADAAPYQIAEVYALRRDPDQMFAWLDRAWTSRDPGIQTLLYDPFILRYQHDPRFAAFYQKVGLPTSTDAKAIP